MFPWTLSSSILKTKLIRTFCKRPEDRIQTRIDRIDVDIRSCMHSRCSKQFNGFYCCPPCCMRAIHKFGAHSYPQIEKIVMRSSRMQEQFAQYAAQGDVRERIAKKKEVKTLGVKSYPQTFQIKDNLTLTCPVDTMHQTLKGVSEDIIDFFVGLSSSTGPIDQAVEVFKRSEEIPRKIRLLKFRV